MTAVRAVQQSSVCFVSVSGTLNKDQRGLCARTVAVTCSLMPESVWALKPVDLCCYLQLRVARLTLVNTVPPIQVQFHSIPTELSLIFKMVLILFSCMQPFNIPTTVYILYRLYFWTLSNEGRAGVTDWDPGRFMWEFGCRRTCLPHACTQDRFTVTEEQWWMRPTSSDKLTVQSGRSSFGNSRSEPIEDSVIFTSSQVGQAYSGRTDHCLWVKNMQNIWVLFVISKMQQSV